MFESFHCFPVKKRSILENAAQSTIAVSSICVLSLTSGQVDYEDGKKYEQKEKDEWQLKNLHISTIRETTKENEHLLVVNS